MLLCNRMEHFILERGKEMANKDDEIDKILNEIKGSKSPEDSKPNNSQTQVREKSQASSAPDNTKREAPLEPALNEFPVKKRNTEEYKDEYEEEEVDLVKDPAKKKIIIAVIAVIAVVAIAVAVYFGVFYGKEEPTTQPETTTTTTAAPVVITNPLTGEADYNESAVGKRPVAIVVENSPQARPQYNMDTPDIIFEGEVEGGITRMLWFYADMTDLPEQVGPTRSARPSFVEFSQLFDSIFIHFGESHSKGDYTGADDYIEDNDVDNIDGMSTSACFKRTSDKSSPHNAVLVGDKLESVIESKEYRTNIDDNGFSALSFNKTATAVSQTPCNSITVKFSSRTDSHTFTYNTTDKLYQNQSDYEQLVSFENIIVLNADTKYIDKNDYKGSGKTETYCNFELTSGTGKLASAGTVTDFTWKVESGVLKLTTADGSELKLNPGRSWIGLSSANNGGTTEVK